MAILEKIEPGLWRWSARHPEWRPNAAPGSAADWPQSVGCVLCDAADATVLIDPLVPPGEERLLGALDEHVSRRGRHVAVLTTIGFHRRSRDQLAKRYGATTSRAKNNLPAGVESFPIRGAGETIFWLAEHRALVPGDRIIGAQRGRLRLCPESWLRYLPSGITLAALAEALRPLLDLEIERVLVSHGEPVLGGGRKALEAALRPACGRPHSGALGRC
jgi:hypothetical protein